MTDNCFTSLRACVASRRRSDARNRGKPRTVRSPLARRGPIPPSRKPLRVSAQPKTAARCGDDDNQRAAFEARDPTLRHPYSRSQAVTEPSHSAISPNRSWVELWSWQLTLSNLLTSRMLTADRFSPAFNPETLSTMRGSQEEDRLKARANSQFGNRPAAIPFREMSMLGRQQLRCRSRSPQA